MTCVIGTNVTCLVSVGATLMCLYVCVCVCLVSVGATLVCLYVCVCVCLVSVGATLMCLYVLKRTTSTICTGTNETCVVSVGGTHRYCQY